MFVCSSLATSQFHWRMKKLSVRNLNQPLIWEARISRIWKPCAWIKPISTFDRAADPMDLEHHNFHRFVYLVTEEDNCFVPIELVRYISPEGNQQHTSLWIDFCPKLKRCRFFTSCISFYITYRSGVGYETRNRVMLTFLTRLCLIIEMINLIRLRKIVNFNRN